MPEFEKQYNCEAFFDWKNCLNSVNERKNLNKNDGSFWSSVSHQTGKKLYQTDYVFKKKKKKKKFKNKECKMKIKKFRQTSIKLF